jgi:putative intracellular protease/amidase
VQIVILLHEGVAAAEALGPFAVLRRVPGADVRFVAVEPGLYLAHDPPVQLVANDALERVPHPDVVVIPGGFGAHAMMESRELVEWVRAVHATSTWTTAISTGSLLLGEAGVLTGLRVTGHWLTIEELEQLGARPVAGRVVEDGKVMTAIGGVSAIELALHVAERIGGGDTVERIRREIMIDPESFEPKQSATLLAAVRRWHREANVQPDAPSARWRRALKRLRRGSRFVITDFDDDHPQPVG